ncbi:MAG: Rieske 2Fe-2S domain-containing protein [Hydrogenophaga sp.]|uniref:Rieske 2Fe-2S domain-containing protein n=1 Tax=Hydrogenophaga crocea TaxID=2716225 RepID=A0A6G8ID85_9BURK|nr:MULTISPECIES: Rieske 2Fe-2S domain-containing protein [Hydrogenophaga]MBL0945420.1 Rieske 2Fe-2S domain-containing protein [Hydrogenophaga sp.]QIM50986.1 Rieske 2Fe-2S domain-containing protein [Hydrogenophaga crocea]
MPTDDLIPLCNSRDLVDGGQAVSFDVNYAGQTCRAFVVRYRGRTHAYLNRCTHVAMEMDWQPDRFFDDSGQWLLCATHGAAYAPDTGECRGGPCRGGLFKIETEEHDGVVHWRSQYHLKPVEF